MMMTNLLDVYLLNGSVPFANKQKSFTLMNSKDHPDVETLKEFVEFAEKLAVEAGVWIKEALDQPKNVSSKSSSIDVVTETDRKCEDYIIAEIKKKFPLHNVIGEESYAEAGKSGYDFSNSVPNWVIDPIDGTNNFVGFEYFKRISEMLSLGARISIFLCLYWNFNW
jgi:hypothetical protein